MNKFSSLSLGLVLSIFSGACGTALNQPALSANNDRDGIATSSEVEIYATAKPDVTLIACDVAGNENSLWSIPSSTDQKRYTFTAVQARLKELYGSAPRTAVQDCNADPNEPASGEPRHLASK